MTSSNKKIERPETFSITIAILVSLIVIITSWAGAFYFLRSHLNERTIYIDTSSSIQAIFSSLAFAGVIITILLQRKELQLQRQELKDTRAELTRSAIAQEKSEETLKRQAENLKISAKLTALNTLVNFYLDKESQIQPMGLTGRGYNHTNKLQEYLAQIEEILENKNTANG